MLQMSTSTLTAGQTAVLGKLLVETLSGSISDETLTELRALPKANMPEPYGHLARYAGGNTAGGERLAKEMLDELRIVCLELQEQ